MVVENKFFFQIVLQELDTTGRPINKVGYLYV